MKKLSLNLHVRVPISRNQSTGQSPVSFNTVGLVSVTVASTSYIHPPIRIGYIKVDFTDKDLFSVETRNRRNLLPPPLISQLDGKRADMTGRAKANNPAPRRKLSNAAANIADRNLTLDLRLRRAHPPIKARRVAIPLMPTAMNARSCSYACVSDKPRTELGHLPALQPSLTLHTSKSDRGFKSLLNPSNRDRQ
jgi:hypothetical protein